MYVCMHARVYAYVYSYTYTYTYTYTCIYIYIYICIYIYIYIQGEIEIDRQTDRQIDKIRLDQIRLDQIGLDQIRLDQIDRQIDQIDRSILLLYRCARTHAHIPQTVLAPRVSYLCVTLVPDFLFGRRRPPHVTPMENSIKHEEVFDVTPYRNTVKLIVFDVTPTETHKN